MIKANATAPAGGGRPVRNDDCSTRRKCEPRATATGDQSSPHPGPARHEDAQVTQRDLWSARCLERGTPGAGNGPGKRIGRKTSTAPRADFTTTRSAAPRSPANPSSTPSSSVRWNGSALCLKWSVGFSAIPRSPTSTPDESTCSSVPARKCSGWHGLTTEPRRARSPSGSPNCWVVAGIMVQLPFRSRPVCLPVLARLWRPRHTGKIAHARELAELIAARYPDRIVHVVGDAAYVGERLRNLQNR